MTVLDFFLYGWYGIAGFSLFAFIWGIVRGWEIEILIPMATGIIGSAVWWVLYLVVDKFAQHVTFH